MRAAAGRVGAVLATAVTAVLAGAIPLVAAGGGTAVAATPSMSMTVDAVTPPVPAVTNRPAPLAIQVTLTNNTARAMSGVQIDLQRGSPYQSQQALDDQIDATSGPSEALATIPLSKNTQLTIPAGSPVTTTIHTVTDIVDGHGICLCANGVYPLFLSAHVAGSDGTDQTVATTRTLLPSFFQRPRPVHVAWVWPLLDRPHRLASSTTFLDDELANEVTAPDGRLSRALQVVEQVGPTTPLTLVLDPEILDELQVMATRTYRVNSTNDQGRQTTTRGTGGVAALAWLQRLRDVISLDSKVTVELTPYADPDVQSLAAAGLQPDLSMPESMQTDVTNALGGTLPQTTVSWPAAGTLTGDALGRLADSGVGTVVLDSEAIKHSSAPTAAGLARLRVDGHDVAAALVSPTIRRYAAAAVDDGGGTGAALPKLLSELAMRVVTDTKNPHTAVLAAPRYVDPSVTAAVQAIRSTNSSTFSSPVALTNAVANSSLLPAGRSSLARPPRSADALPGANVDAARQMTTALPMIRSLLTGDSRSVRLGQQATTLLSSLPLAAQRISASAWRRGSYPGEGVNLARRLSGFVSGFARRVHIVVTSHSYTLASNNSPLPVTVENDLPYPVYVLVRLRTALSGQPGFRQPQQPKRQLVDADSKRTLHVPTQVDRSGRIKVDAALYAPNGAALGSPVPITVRSTALGTVGLVITIVAGAALGLALLVRAIRGLAWRRRVAVDRRAAARAHAAAHRADENSPASLQSTTP